MKEWHGKERTVSIAAVAAVGLIVAFRAIFAKNAEGGEDQSSKGSLSPRKTLARLGLEIDRELQASEIEDHIQRTQMPAAGLGISVSDLTETSLTLSAPLSLNSNVHGTAFAGSLYSVGCLASYYILRYWMRLQPGFEDMGLHLVARGGSVEYLRPVKGDIVAVSTLPDKEEMGQFTEAVEQGKGFVKVRGVVRLEDGIGKGEIVREGEEESRALACTYEIELCAYRPRRRKD